MYRGIVILMGLCALAAASTLPAHAERRVALVIGNSAYSSVAKLANPSRDARSLADAFERLDFETITLKQDLTYSEFRRTLSDFARLADNADIAVIYYAGHGIEVGGQNYLVPIDAKLRAARDVDFEGMPLSQIMTALEGAKKLRLVILDACRDNPFLARMDRGVSTRSIGRGLASVAPGANTLVAYAAKEGTTADDGTGGNSPYAKALLSHLETPGLEIGFLFRRIRDAVLKETGGRQEPFVYGSLAGEEFYLKPGNRPAPPAGNSAEVAALQQRLQALEQQLKEKAGQEKAGQKVAVVAPPQRAPDCTTIGANWSQASQRNGRITSRGASYVLHGANWTNGRLRNGVLDGNAIVSQQTFDFSNGGTAYLQFTMDGGGKYMAVFPYILQGIGGQHLSTHHSRPVAALREGRRPARRSVSADSEQGWIRGDFHPPRRGKIAEPESAGAASVRR